MTSRNAPTTSHSRRIQGPNLVWMNFTVLPTLTTDCQDLIKIIANLNLCNVISSLNFIILISLSQAITSSMQNRKINCKYKI